MVELSRCFICGKHLTRQESILNGIGPICIKKTESREGIREISEIVDSLRLPCNKFDCDNCPFKNNNRTLFCPRERIYIKSDIYPLHEDKPRFCSFCEKEVHKGKFRKYCNKKKNRFVIECSECYEKNKTWRLNQNGK